MRSFSPHLYLSERGLKLRATLESLVGLRRFAGIGRGPMPIPNFRQVLAGLVDVLLVLDQLILESTPKNLEFWSSASLLAL